MDSSIYLQVLKIFVVLPVVILLIVITLKYGGKYMHNLTNGRIIKVYERVPVGKDTFLMVVTIADKPYLISSGNNGVQILKEIDEDILNSYKTNPANNNISDLNLMSYIHKIKGKMKNEKI